MDKYRELAKNGRVSLIEVVSENFKVYHTEVGLGYTELDWEDTNTTEFRVRVEAILDNRRPELHGNNFGSIGALVERYDSEEEARASFEKYRLLAAEQDVEYQTFIEDEERKYQEKKDAERAEETLKANTDYLESSWIAGDLSLKYGRLERGTIEPTVNEKVKQWVLSQTERPRFKGCVSRDPIGPEDAITMECVTTGNPLLNAGSHKYPEYRPFSGKIWLEGTSVMYGTLDDPQDNQPPAAPGLGSFSDALSGW